MKTYHSFLHKDCNRDWWKIDLKIGEPEPDKYDPDTIDHWWHYRLLKENGTGKYVLVDEGEIWEQFDMVPKVSDVMKMVANKFVSLAISVAKEHG